MARPTWRGAISFGLVNVPVQLFTAVRSQDVRFRQLSKHTKQPVLQQRIDPETGEEVAYQDLVKGYEVSDGRYVIVDPDELGELDPSASRLIDILDYVEQGEIDPVYYDRAYYLAPDGETASKPYRLLTEAMQASGKVAVARFVMRDKEYIAAIRARDGMLVLSTMHHYDEVADPAEFGADEFTASIEVREREVQMAEQLIESMTTSFDPEAYPDEHRQRVLDYLQAKAEGEQVQISTQKPETGEVIDLMAALERSLDRARGGDGDGKPDSAGAEGEPAAGTSDGRYQSMTRDQLYDLAQERDLPGRSGMSKAELATALQESDAKSGAA